MRRLPGPAVWRLSEGGQTPEALSELFRDWQRTQTQSSATALRSPRQQMDVRFCKSRNHQPRGTAAHGSILIRSQCALSRARPETSRAFPLTLTHMEVGNTELSMPTRVMSVLPVIQPELRID